MERRTFLATTIAGGAVATAGCSSLVGGSTLDAAAPVREGDRTTKFIEFTKDGERRAGLTLSQGVPLQSPTEPFGFGFVLNHTANGYDDSVAERYQVDVRAPPAGGVLFNPGSLTDWPVTMERLGDGWTRISADLGGERGDSNVDLPMRIDPFHEPVDAVEFRIDIELSAGGLLAGTSHIDHETTFDPVVESS